MNESVKRSDGEAAFPHEFEWSHRGMTLRDYFAAQALNAIISNSGLVTSKASDASELICRDAYELADAMLRERQK